MPDTTPEYVETIRRLLRAEYGTQARVADATGIPRHTLKGIATGRSTTPERLDAIARALGRRIVIAEG